MGKQVRPSIIALLAAASLVLLAAVGFVASLPDGSRVSDEELVRLEGLTTLEESGVVAEYSNCASVIGCLVPNTPYPDPNLAPVTTSEDARDVPKFGNDASLSGLYVPTSPYPDPNLEADALEYQTLLASLSPGVRANYRAWLLDRADAREKQRERDKAGAERDEAEYAAFIEERLRRLSRN